MIDSADLQGHWCRAWIKAPGLEDHSTQVHWLQSGAFFADIRVPVGLPQVDGAASLAELGPEILGKWLSCEGFAGTIEVTEGICTWHRQINWHGATSQVDAGCMSFDAAGDLVEEGTFAEYTELWQRFGRAPLEAHKVAGDGREGVFLSSKDVFILGLGRPGATSSTALATELDAGRLPPETAEFFRDVYLYGRWAGHEGTVMLSTDPLLVGRPALSRRGEALVLRRQDFIGRAYEVAFALGCAASPLAQMAR